MSPGFADEKRLLAQAKALLETPEGKLRLWHFTRHKPYQGVPYRERTQGDLLEEFYMVVAAEVDELRDRKTELGASELNRLDKLEIVLDGGDGGETGDPLADYWEYRLEHDLPVDFGLKAAPARNLWDHAGEQP